MKVSLSWLKKYVDIAASMVELAEVITMGSVEVEECTAEQDGGVLTLAPTPNRGDCLSMVGVARDVAALTGKKFKFRLPSAPKGKGKMADLVQIIVNDKEACPRYTSRVIKGVKIGPTPVWLADSLESVGIRSINNVVDATNFVLMELGQPVHAFDLRFLQGNKLIIDKPDKPCKMMALDENEYEFTPDDILNLDESRPIGAAGIMGAENSGVQDDTETLVLESAYFDPQMVRRTSKRTGLSSESSKRFERGVDPEGVILGLHRLTELIVEIAGGMPTADWVDFYPKKFDRVIIELSAHDVNWLLGSDIDLKTIVRLLESVGCEIKKSSGKDNVKVIVPTYRPDITRKVDLIEEVARLYGYDKIESTLPSYKTKSQVLPPYRSFEKIVKSTLVDHGFYEAKTYSFSTDDDLKIFSGDLESVRLVNPLLKEEGHMRRSLLPALIRVMKVNLNRRITDIKLFEMSRVFEPAENVLPNEGLSLAGLVTGDMLPGRWDGSGKVADLFDVKAVVWSIFSRLGLSAPEIQSVKGRGFLHPTDSFAVIFNGRDIGVCGRLHPSLEKQFDALQAVYLFEVDFRSICEVAVDRVISYKPVSKYPTITRDVALLVDLAVTHKELLQSFKKYVNNMVQRVELFDIYEGKGVPETKKSMAYRVSFGSDERTLEDAEVDGVFKMMVDGVKSELDVVVR